jgi:hypothetical protein
MFFVTSTNTEIRISHIALSSRAAVIHYVPSTLTICNSVFCVYVYRVIHNLNSNNQLMLVEIWNGEVL